MLTTLNKKHLFQWDTKQKLILGDEQFKVSHVDFILDNEILKVLPQDGTIAIPDELLQNGGSYICWLCYKDGTVRRFTFCVEPRPKPVDYAYTPTERENFQDLRDSIDELWAQFKTIEDKAPIWDAKSDFSGSYDDLTDKPELFDGRYESLTGKPHIPSALSEMTQDVSHMTVSAIEKMTWNNKSEFSGNYDDLINKPVYATVTDVDTYFSEKGE